MAGLDASLQEWTKPVGKAWENEYDFRQTNRFAKLGGGKYTITNCNKTTYIECVPETKSFFKMLNGH